MRLAKKLPNRLLFIALCCAIWLALASCGPRFEDMSAAEISSYAQDRFENKKYSDAIDAYEALIDLYPFSMYVTLAELGLADAEFARKRWIEAEAAYDAFAKRHPNHDKIDHAIYHSGMCSYEQKLAIDRDQTQTQKAESNLSKVVSQYPDSSYYAEARLHLKEVRNDLAKRERYVAKHYWRDKEYYAAYKRYERIFRLFSDTDYYEEALYYGARCLINLDENRQAERLLDQLLRRFPDGKYADDAKDLLAETD
ncbi:MAG: outer membrane protein assembly factor BamD [Candidatus Lernaella stagnicola]|nr:outer membrane protein assembly factor BamD [Candidatus Lernaella stagnicola]